MDPAIQVASLTVEYATPRGPVRALDGVSLTVNAGSSLAVTGPSGCGKSTLLAILGGLAVPTAGTARVGAMVVSSLPERRRCQFRRAHVGFVYQADDLLPFLTVVENVAFQFALQGEAIGGATGFVFKQGFYTQRDLFDSPTTLDYASFVRNVN